MMIRRRDALTPRHPLRELNAVRPEEHVDTARITRSAEVLRRFLS